MDRCPDQHRNKIRAIASALNSQRINIPNTRLLIKNLATCFRSACKHINNATLRLSHATLRLKILSELSSAGRNLYLFSLHTI